MNPLTLLTSLLLAGCLLQPESKTQTITCDLSRDAVYDDPMPPVPETLAVVDGVCKGP